MEKRPLPQVGEEDVNPPLAGRQEVAVLTCGRGSGGGRGEPATAVMEGRRHRHRGLLVIRRACGPVEERAGVASHLCGAATRGTMSGSTPGTEFRHTEKRPSRGVCAFLFLLEFLSVRPPHCGEEAHVPGIDAVLRKRDRAMTASASAVTLRGIPRRHGENVESTVRTRSASESGTVQISSVTSSCTASGPRRSASIAERESVATGTRVGDLDAAARRGTENCLSPCSVAGHSARQEHARLPAAAR
ncbi:hypothetical protein TcBrA4_0111130 [Trypanosoma cruzi]|nr:hypothetical protein TcBrA4_0111130 [Trypanosoma cruzi]